MSNQKETQIQHWKYIKNWAIYKNIYQNVNIEKSSILTDAIY